jgi:MHS family proline/betaine transporter-like MFS transporter
MRPVGSILFGIYGDRHGRRRALSAVVFVMALATFAMGLLPTYGQVGVLAPALLVVVRMFQGLSAGGEWGGSTAYIVEFAPFGQRGFFGSWQLVGVGGGFLLGSLTAAVLNAFLSQPERLAWGWRLPFLVRVTDNSHAPAVYVIIAAIITLVVLLRTRETAFAPLR